MWYAERYNHLVGCHPSVIKLSGVLIEFQLRGQVKYYRYTTSGVFVALVIWPSRLMVSSMRWEYLRPIFRSPPEGCPQPFARPMKKYGRR